MKPDEKKNTQANIASKQKPKEAVTFVEKIEIMNTPKTYQIGSPNRTQKESNLPNRSVAKPQSSASLTPNKQPQVAPLQAKLPKNLAKPPIKQESHANQLKQQRSNLSIVNEEEQLRISTDKFNTAPIVAKNLASEEIPDQNI